MNFFDPGWAEKIGPFHQITRFRPPEQRPIRTVGPTMKKCAGGGGIHHIRRLETTRSSKWTAKKAKR